MILAIFDLDDTLTLQDTESLWQAYLVDKGLIDSQIYLEKRQEFQQSYQQGLLCFEDVIKFSLGPIAGWSHASQQALLNSFKKDFLPSIILKEAQRRVSFHKQQGHTTLILSAGHEFLIPTAASFFEADSVLCTQLEKSADGAVLPILKGKALYRDQKVRALLDWLQGRSPQQIFFYSDSINDLPLLEFCTQPHVVHPCSKLKAVALERQWPILSWLEPTTVDSSV